MCGMASAALRTAQRTVTRFASVTKRSAMPAEWRLKPHTLDGTVARARAGSRS